jgi:CheY-like chemotaxis protein
MATVEEFQPPVVLVVEDEFLVREYAAGILEQGGFEVLQAKNARQALSLLEERQDIEVVFTDIHMPGDVDGLWLAREVRARWPHILLLMASGLERPCCDEIPDPGGFIPKPYEPEAVLKRVRRLMDWEGGRQ